MRVGIHLPWSLSGGQTEKAGSEKEREHHLRSKLKKKIHPGVGRSDLSVHQSDANGFINGFMNGRSS